jgi:hypothetical protein
MLPQVVQLIVSHRIERLNVIDTKKNIAEQLQFAIWIFPSNITWNIVSIKFHGHDQRVFCGNIVMRGIPLSFMKNNFVRLFKLYRHSSEGLKQTISWFFSCLLAWEEFTGGEFFSNLMFLFCTIKVN